MVCIMSIGGTQTRFPNLPSYPPPPRFVCWCSTRRADEFVVHTPTASARKAYIGNAMMGDYAVVFAQLVVGGRGRGPHAFIVPIRNSAGEMHEYARGSWERGGMALAFWVVA